MNNWIKRIEVRSLWGRFNVTWPVTQQVSVLAGGNGTGKSTILRSLSTLLTNGSVDPQQTDLFEELIVTFNDNTAISTNHTYDIATFLHKLYANFMPMPISASLTENTLFCDTLDSLLVVGGKHIIRNSAKLEFELFNGKHIGFDHLSAGEKELIRLFSIATKATAGDVLILDEPELSLHFDWQQRLIDDLLILGGGELQLIISTHSPAIVMHGWMANITQIESVTTEL